MAHLSCSPSSPPVPYPQFESTRIYRSRRPILDIPIKVTVPCFETKRILTGPAPQSGIIPPRPIVLQPGFDVKFPPGPLVAVAPRRRRRLARHVPVAVVGDGVLHRPRIIRDIPHRP